MTTLWSFTALPAIISRGWREATMEEILTVCPRFEEDFYCGDSFIVDPLTNAVVSLQEGWKIENARKKLELEKK